MRGAVLVAVLGLASCGRLGFEDELDVPTLPDAAHTPTQAIPDAGAAQVSLVAVLVADDDGSRRVEVTPAEVAAWVDQVNLVFADANVAFVFDPARDVSYMNSTLLNQMMGIGDPNWAQEMALGNTIAAEHPGTVVVLFRHGPGAQPTGSAFSWTDYDFVVAPSLTYSSVCGHPNVSLLSLVLGHYFGLSKTFGGYQHATLAQAADVLALAGDDVSIFDGDGNSDTAPDPNVDELVCDTSTRVTLNGTTFPIPRDNVMSFLDHPTKHLTAQQAGRVRETLARRFGP